MRSREITQFAEICLKKLITKLVNLLEEIFC